MSQEQSQEFDPVKQPTPTSEDLAEIASTADEQARDAAIAFGAARFKYFQQRAQRQAQYAAQGYRMPPTDYTNLSYLTYCVSRGLAMMMGHG